MMIYGCWILYTGGHHLVDFFNMLPHFPMVQTSLHKWVWVCMGQNQNPVDRVVQFITATIQLLEYPSLIQTWILFAFWSSQKGAGLSETNVYPIPSHGCTKANYPYQNGHKLRVNPTPTSFWQISVRYYPSNYWNLPPFIVCHYPGPLYPFSTSEEKNWPWGLPWCAAHGRWDLGPRSAHTSLKCSLASHKDFSAMMVTAGFQHGKKHRLGCGANTCKTARYIYIHTPKTERFGQHTASF